MWISVKDRLPLSFEDVLVWFEGGEQSVDVANYDEEEDLWVLPHQALNWADCWPTHWQPLPSAPEGE